MLSVPCSPCFCATPPATQQLDASDWHWRPAECAFSGGQRLFPLDVCSRCKRRRRGAHCILLVLLLVEPGCRPEKGEKPSQHVVQRLQHAAPALQPRAPDVLSMPPVRPSVRIPEPARRRSHSPPVFRVKAHFFVQRVGVPDGGRQSILHEASDPQRRRQSATATGAATRPGAAATMQRIFSVRVTRPACSQTGRGCLLACEYERSPVVRKLPERTGCAGFLDCSHHGGRI